MDLTSAPSDKKPITVSECMLMDKVLSVQSYSNACSRDGFLSRLNYRGPWIAGLDFPFGQSRRFLNNTGYAQPWPQYVSAFGGMERKEWVRFLDDYKRDRPSGDKQHKRKVDRLAGGASPQTHSYTPVGLMFHFAAPLLLEARVYIPGLFEEGDPSRIVVEAYPGVLVRDGIGKVSYKHDDAKKQSMEHVAARRRIVEYLISNDFRESFGFVVSFGEFEERAVVGPSGDTIDAVICAAQAAWAWMKRDDKFGYAPDFDRLEGWIPQPNLMPSR